MTKVFEVILKGFNGGTDETDNLIKWIAAERKEDVKKIMDATFSDYDIVETDIHPDQAGIDMVIRPSFFNVSLKESCTIKESAEDAINMYSTEQIAENAKEVREGLKQRLELDHDEFIFDAETSYDEDEDKPLCVALRYIHRDGDTPSTIVFNFD